MSDLHADYRALFYTSSDNFDFGGVNDVIDSLTAKCREFFKGPGAGAIDHTIEVFAEARYRHQIWEIDLPLTLNRFKTPKEVARVRGEFDKAHEEIFAVLDPDSDVEFVGWRAIARCKLRAGKFGKLGHEKKFEAKLPARRKAHFNGSEMKNTRVLLFEAMKTGATLKGPAIIESPFTTVVIDPGAKASRTRSGSLVIEV